MNRIPELTDAGRAELRRQLDVPGEARLHITDSGETFGDVVVQFFGVDAPDLGGQPWWGYGEDGHAMQVRMIRLHHARARAFLERRWHPTYGMGPLTVICPNGRVTENDVTLIWRMRGELQEMSPRPGPTGGYDPVLARAVSESYWNHLEDPDNAETKRACAEDVGISRTHLYTVIHHIGWPPPRPT
jgi:hypothetical protein